VHGKSAIERPIPTALVSAWAHQPLRRVLDCSAEDLVDKSQHLCFKLALHVTPLVAGMDICQPAKARAAARQIQPFAAVIAITILLIRWQLHNGIYEICCLCFSTNSGYNVRPFHFGDF
jgi:hypothetical protein